MRDSTTPVGRLTGLHRARTPGGVRRNSWLWALGLLVPALIVGLVVSRGPAHRSAPRSHPVAKHPVHGAHPTPSAAANPEAANPRLDPDWSGDGRSVTFAFGGDVSFPPGSNLGHRLADDPTTALGPTVKALLAGSDVSMTNFESALTDGTCADAQPKQYVFSAPVAAVQAFVGAGVTLVTEANNHGEDCGRPGLLMALAERAKSGFPILGIGRNADEAFTPFRATINGQKIAIIAATQVIDSGLRSSWTATATQAGLASAYDVDGLVSAVEAARNVSDTVVVYLHWGTELENCPTPRQEKLADVLVSAGADIVVGAHAHVLLGGGYLGSAYVDYGLGNFAFYDNSPPQNESGALVISATGRHIGSVTWRPAAIADDLPRPLTGNAAARAVESWNAARGCTDVSAAPRSPVAAPSTETAPAPAAVVQELSRDGG